MCQFKSGIILKHKCVICEGDNDSHSDLLASLKIEDSYNNASRIFVRAELVPKNGEWWTDPTGWDFRVDQDITPEWFELDKDKYIAEFKDAVFAWWKIHVLIDQKIDELSSGYYRLKRCEVKKLLNDVTVMSDNSTVTRMYGNSTVTRMYGNSTVTEMYGNSTVTEMYDNSTVTEMYDNSTVTRMYGNSTVTEMYGNSTVTRMYDNSTVTRMYDNSTVTEMYGNSSARDYSKGKFYIAENCNLEIMKRG